MPIRHALLQPTTPTPIRRLLAIVLVVLLAHAMLLGGVTAWVAWAPPTSGKGADPDSVGFSTRTIAETPKAEAPRPTAPVAVAPPPATATAPPTAPPSPPPDAEPAAHAAQDGVAAPTPASTAVDAPTTTSTSASSPATPAPGPQGPQTAKAMAAPHPAPPAHFPDSARLEFEGRGQEKGYVNYYGSAVLQWKRNPQNYEVSLEISAFGFRLITWTSKGALAAQGLEPLRFGDRRRGPEVATHFQRDKGLITFSSNRPEIPLQPGAQDKLSALLQVTALVSADPAHYAAGSKIVFQAADAYRAEPWEFVVGAPETMELPGGTLNVVGFVKNPTVEFDQKIELWLSPEQAWLPVRLRITEANGTYSDLLWRRTTKAD